ncbi:hypothetical protein OQX61_01535 [Pedobacter sp. PLR]|uniref:hypothetical protein n=1 Tax=Pedobacter sp. PLR TaxID=2994465 RepID=UPI002245A7A4|nr:hypothetical protein [Pedobacter sp. PLR]MCX2449940.1 hypothetical protein [Pedobacter sp. PLR]
MKNLFFSLLVVGVAFAGSAFTNQKIVATKHYVQNPDGSYTLMTEEFDPINCLADNNRTCAYEQISTDELLPTLSLEEVILLAAPQTPSNPVAPKLQPVGIATGTYN